MSADLPALNQRAVPDRDAGVMCGETCCAAIATARGAPTSPEDVITWMRDNLGGESVVGGGTSVAADQAWYHAHGFSTDDGVSFPGDDAYGRGEHLHLLIWGDHNCDPQAGMTVCPHYIAGQDHQGGATLTMNPWGGRKVRYADGQLGPATRYVFSVGGGHTTTPGADDATLLAIL